jgi:hypothetical protein
MSVQPCITNAPTHHRPIVTGSIRRDLAQHQEKIDGNDASIRKPPRLAAHKGLIHCRRRSRRHGDFFTSAKAVLSVV